MDKLIQLVHYLIVLINLQINLINNNQICQDSVNFVNKWNKIIKLDHQINKLEEKIIKIYINLP